MANAYILFVENRALDWDASMKDLVGRTYGVFSTLDLAQTAVRAHYEHHQGTDFKWWQKQHSANVWWAWGYVGDTQFDNTYCITEIEMDTFDLTAHP